MPATKAACLGFRNQLWIADCLMFFGTAIYWFLLCASLGPLLVYCPKFGGRLRGKFGKLAGSCEVRVADNVLPCVEVFASVEASQLFSRLHRHGPGVVVFKKTTKGGLRIHCIELQSMRSDRERGVHDADSLEPDDRIDRREISNRNGRVEEKLGVEVQDVALINHGHAIALSTFFHRSPGQSWEC